jgi:hypothetical protein
MKYLKWVCIPSYRLEQRVFSILNGTFTIITCQSHYTWNFEFDIPFTSISLQLAPFILYIYIYITTRRTNIGILYLNETETVHDPLVPTR